jgi:hypothetical protein
VTLVKVASAAATASPYYALKQMTKAYIKAQGLVRHVHREKQVRAQRAASYYMISRHGK